MQRKISFVLAVASVCVFLMNTGCALNGVLNWIGGLNSRHSFLP